MPKSVNLKTLPEHDTMVVNITSVYDDASDLDNLEGMGWYDEALELARNLAAGTQFTVRQIVGVIAVISQSMAWENNKVLPRYVIDLFMDNIPVELWTGPTGNQMAITVNQRIKCRRILEGEDPALFMGPKTGAFFRNILGCKDSVTVDRWAIRAAVGERKLTGATPAAIKKIAEAYVEVARKKMIDPRCAQAVVWVTYRKKMRGGR